MALCSTSELVNLTGTTYSTTILDDIIAEADRTIGTWLSFAGLSLPGSDNDLKSASLKLSICGILTRMRLDGTKPAQLRIGDLTVSDDIESAITNLTAKAREHTQAYIKSHGSDDRARYYLRKVNA